MVLDAPILFLISTLYGFIISETVTQASIIGSQRHPYILCGTVFHISTSHKASPIFRLNFIAQSNADTNRIIAPIRQSNTNAGNHREFSYRILHFLCHRSYGSKQQHPYYNILFHLSIIVYTSIFVNISIISLYLYKQKTRWNIAYKHPHQQEKTTIFVDISQKRKRLREFFGEKLAYIAHFS